MYKHARMLQFDLVQFEMCVEFLDRNVLLVVRNTVLKLIREVRARDTDGGIITIEMVLERD